jgi:capsule assembly protein Wzi
MMKTSVLLALLLISVMFFPARSWALASNNIPLDSPVYFYIEKLSGFGLLDSDVKGLKPYSKAEAARLLLEAEGNLTRFGAEAPVFASELMLRLRELLQREVSLQNEPDKAPFVDYNILSAARLRYVYLDGVPRSYNRTVFIRGGQSAFGFIGGKLRPDSDAGLGHQTGTEGTPLLENNEGVIYRAGSNAELRWSMEGFVKDKVSLLIEPIALAGPDSDRLALQKGYLKIGSGGLELEVGRDATWFGPGYRGALTISNNAKNFDLVKLSSPEPIDVGWVKHYLGDVKYALVVSRFDETGSGSTLRQPYFIGIKLAVKPKPWYEIGVNFVRQEGGPGFTGSSSFRDLIFGGGTTNHNNTIAGIDLRFRIPWLRNTELYGEYAGEDSASFWPFVESYVAGFYIPRLTSSGRDDLRFEFFYGNPMLYTDFKFPAGYVYNGMIPGHSQGGSALEFYTRYSHWFSPRNNVALEYFHTDRGREGRVGNQQTEGKNAWRAFWNVPLYGDMDMNLMYGWERINNFNLVDGAKQTNQLVKVDLSYRY